MRCDPWTQKSSRKVFALWQWKFLLHDPSQDEILRNKCGSLQGTSQRVLFMAFLFSIRIHQTTENAGNFIAKLERCLHPIFILFIYRRVKRFGYLPFILTPFPLGTVWFYAPGWVEIVSSLHKYAKHWIAFEKWLLSPRK